MTGAAAPVRVALLNPTFWPEVQRGTERVMGGLASDLAAAGHLPRVITSHPGRPRASTELGYPVLRSWRPPDGLLALRGYQQHLTHLPFTYLALALARGEDEVAHAFHQSDAAAAVIEARRSGRPTVFSFMGIPQRRALAAGRHTLSTLLRAVGGADAVVSLSRAASEGLSRWLGASSRTIYPGVDLDHFSPGGERDDAPTIVCAASPDDPRKRVDLLARAFARVHHERADARLLLWRPRQVELERQLAARSGAIEFFDAGPHEVVSVFRRAWVSVLPSYGEAFGLVLAESLACGTPVVGTADGGIPEIVDREEIGRLFAAEGGEEELARAILEALELHGQPGIAEACRARAREFGREEALAAHLALYRELMSRT